MTDTQEPMTPAIRDFRRLHESGCFVIPNPWDAGSARYLTQLGFKALATTSAGLAFSEGLTDSSPRFTVEIVLQHVREIVAASTLPVSVDFQSGYSANAEGLAANVTACVRAGAAGLSIEDASGDSANPLYGRKVALERLKAAREAIDRSGTAAVLTARCEAFLTGHADPIHEVIDRLVAFADAGADCLFAPGVREPQVIAQLVKAIAPKPLNVVMSNPALTLSVAQLADLGVRRISVGASLARVAWGAFMRAAKSIAETGSFEALTDSASLQQLNDLFADRP